MNRLFLSALGLPFLVGTTALCAAAQSPDPLPADTDLTAPSYDMKGQSLVDLDGVNKKFVSLAQAMPQDKFTWRPASGTRSFAEVLLHVAGERYQILALMGPTPQQPDTKTYEKSTTDKGKIIDELNKSWDFAKSTIGAMKNSEFARPIPKLGPQANAGDVVYILVADAHEHLGQSVAYARMNGVVPPWTAEQQKKMTEKKDKM